MNLHHFSFQHFSQTIYHKKDEKEENEKYFPYILLI